MRARKVDAGGAIGNGKPASFASIYVLYTLEPLFQPYGLESESSSHAMMTSSFRSGWINDQNGMDCCASDPSASVIFSSENAAGRDGLTICAKERLNVWLNAWLSDSRVSRRKKSSRRISCRSSTSRLENWPSVPFEIAESHQKL